MGNAHWLVVWCSFGARVLITGVAGAPHLRMSDARIARLDTYPHVILCQQMQTFDMAMRSHGRRLFDIFFSHVCTYARFLFDAVLQVRYSINFFSSLPFIARHSFCRRSKGRRLVYAAHTLQLSPPLSPLATVLPDKALQDQWRLQHLLSNSLTLIPRHLLIALALIRRGISHTHSMGRQIHFVTGANRGIGLAITTRLVAMGHRVIMGCRAEDKAMEAMEAVSAALAKEVPNARDQMEFIPLDLEKSDTFAPACKMFETLLGGAKVDALINNAGFAFTHAATEPVAVQAEKTVLINYTNTAAFTEAFLPHVADGGRIVFVGSRSGLFSNLKREDHRELLLSDALTSNSLRKFVDSYLAATRDGTHLQKGFTDTTYGMSKIAIIAYSRCLSRDAEVTSRKITVSACCPGWVRTDMTLGEGHKSPEEGADTPVWLATSDEPAALVTGKFFGERKEIDLLSEW